MTTQKVDLKGLSKYVRIAESLRDLITFGHFKVGDTLPDLEHLAKNALEYFGVSAAIGTVRHAEEELIKEGTIAQTQQGIPTKILKDPAKKYDEVFSPLVRQTAITVPVTGLQQELPATRGDVHSFADDVGKILQTGAEQTQIREALCALFGELASSFEAAAERLTVAR